MKSRLHLFIATLASLMLVGGAAAQAANYDCGSAAPIAEGSYVGTLAGVSASLNGSAEAWYSYLPPVSGTVTVRVKTPGKESATAAVLDDCPSADGHVISWANELDSDGATVHAALAGGRLCYIRVTGRSAFTLDVSFTTDVAEGGVAGGVGPDVVYSDATSVSMYGPVNGIRAYSLGTDTCNVGDANLRWGNSWQGSPAVGFNAYRLYDGRLEQIGLGFCKQACCAAAGNGCGIPCNGVGGSMLGVGCRDGYGAGYNAGQSRLGPRSAVNAFTGEFPIQNTGSGDAIYRRLQVRETDLNPANFPGALYFVEGVYVASDDAPNGNSYNNASYKRVTVSSYNMSLVGSMYVGIPAIEAWHDHGLGANAPDDSVHTGFAMVPGEGRFHYAYKVTDLGGGAWRYDYAVFNLNSDRSGGSFKVSVPNGVHLSNIGFHDVDYHSGEPYDNTDWVVASSSTIGGIDITWASPQTFAQNPNSNALRWGTMYNFWFTADRPPTTGTATLGLFKPHTPNQIQFPVSVPMAPAPPLAAGDLNCDGVIDFFDIDPFVLAVFDAPGYGTAYPNCDINLADINDDGAVDFFDIDPFVALLFD